MGSPRPQRAGTWHALISDMLDAAGRRSVSAETGHSASTLSRWADPDPDEGRRMPAQAMDDLARLFPPAAEVAAAHFAHLAGGVFLPAAREDAPGLETAGADLGEAAGRVTAVLLRALDPDGPGGAALTAAERRDLAALADAVVKAARLFQHGLHVRAVKSSDGGVTVARWPGRAA